MNWEPWSNPKPGWGCARSKRRNMVYLACPKLCRKVQFGRDEGEACPSTTQKLCSCPNLRILDLSIFWIASDLEHRVIILAHGWPVVSRWTVLDSSGRSVSLHSLVAPTTAQGHSGSCSLSFLSKTPFSPVPVEEGLRELVGLTLWAW